MRSRLDEIPHTLHVTSLRRFVKCCLSVCIRMLQWHTKLSVQPPEKLHVTVSRCRQEWRVSMAVGDHDQILCLHRCSRAALDVQPLTELLWVRQHSMLYRPQVCLHQFWRIRSRLLREHTEFTRTRTLALPL